LTIDAIRAAIAAAISLLLLACGTSEEPRSVSPYVPSPESVVAEMLELAEVGSDDYVIDLGSGDGRIVLTAAQVFGARGMGVEIEPDLVALANATAREQGIADRVEFVVRDLFETDLSAASVVTMYLLPEVVNALKGKLLRELEPGARVLSHDYPIEGWDAERFVQLDLEEKIEVTGVSRTNLYLYVVPAPVGGRWRVSLPAQFGTREVTLDLEQDVTRVRGTAAVDGDSHALDGVRLRGRQIDFHVPELDMAFSGRVSPGGMQGAVAVGDQYGIWRAVHDAL
jgi:hypothetical protein